MRLQVLRLLILKVLKRFSLAVSADTMLAKKQRAENGILL
jgi:hypothetical protein